MQKSWLLTTQGSNSAVISTIGSSFIEKKIAATLFVPTESSGVLVNDSPGQRIIMPKVRRTSPLERFCLSWKRTGSPQLFVIEPLILPPAERGNVADTISHESSCDIQLSRFPEVAPNKLMLGSDGQRSPPPGSSLGGGGSSHGGLSHRHP